MNEILAGLNARQLEAVTAPAAPLLVLAGPGSGKTHVLTRRAAWWVAAQGVLPHNILCVTFTNRAAQEMQVRLEALLGVRARDVWVHTFHALCTRILRRHAAAAGLSPYFVVADAGTQTEMLIEAVRRLDLSLEAYPPYELADFISEFKRSLRDPAKASPEARVTGEMVAIAAEYDSLLRARGLVDYDDLIGTAVRLLARDRSVRLGLQRSLPHVLVDEYQDINRAQFELLKLLAPAGGDVLAVADDAQSIYGWRGAQPGLISAFRRHYRPAVIRLEQSYRSTRTILFAAENVIRRPDTPYADRPYLEVHEEPGAPIYHYLFTTATQEQQWLVALVRRLVAERGYRFADIAVLYRTHQLADELEGALLQAGIPVERVRRESFFEEPAVREIVRYLRLAHALGAAMPEDASAPGAPADGNSLLAVFNFPQTLADELTILQLQQLAAAHGLALAELARRPEDFPELSPLTRAALREFMALFDEMLLPLAGRPVDVIVTGLFEVLERRRSPFLPEEFRWLRDAAALLSFEEIAIALRDALQAGHKVSLAFPSTIDGACAAAILSQAAQHYLPDLSPMELVAADAGAQGIEIRVASAGTPLWLRPPGGSLGYSLSTLTWRLAQELLVAFEQVGAGPLVAYDLETTGVDVQRDEIVEIAAQRLEAAAPVGPLFHSFVRPPGPIPLAATRVHGIRSEDVQSAEPISAVLPRFLRYVGAQTVLGHHILSFDNRFVDRESGRLYGRGFPNPAVDTLQMVTRLYGDDPQVVMGLSLDALTDRFRLHAGVESTAPGKEDAAPVRQGIADEQETEADAMPAMSAAGRQPGKAQSDVERTIALFRHLLRENALQRGLRALPEYLPLVAIGMAAAGTSLEDENLALWRAAQRELARNRTENVPGLEAARALLSADAGDAFDSAVAALRSDVPPPVDAAWQLLSERFAARVESFLRFSADHSLTAFLDYQALVTGADTTSSATATTAARQSPDRVTLMTLHNAKGTEFPVVIIIGLEEENLPLWTTLSDEAQVSEERRVFYVGLTRAQRQLYLTSVSRRSDGFARAPSRFLSELPSEFVRRFQISPQGEVTELLAGNGGTQTSH